MHLYMIHAEQKTYITNQRAHFNESMLRYSHGQDITLTLTLIFQSLKFKVIVFKQHGSPGLSMYTHFIPYWQNGSFFKWILFNTSICFWFAFNLSAYDMKTKGDKKCGKPNHLNHSHLQTFKCSEFHWKKVSWVFFCHLKLYQKYQIKLFMNIQCLLLNLALKNV